MTKEQTTDNKETRNIGPIEAYEILMQRTIDENRLLTERTTIFLAASSILFLAFVMLSQSSDTIVPILVKWLRIILATLGGFLTFLLYSMNRATHNALEFLWGAQKKVEREAPEFSYMREQGITPQIEGGQFVYGKKRWNIEGTQAVQDKRWWRKPLLFKNASCIWLPLTFIILWLVSLIVAVISYSN